MPRGGMFEFVSCASHFGECLQWGGFALACWSQEAVCVAVFMCALIVPRAWHNHRWCIKHLPSYPSNRNAVIPSVL